MKKIFGIIFLLAVLITITWSVTCRVFDSAFADATIDWFAFLAGIFLAVEATYKIIKRPEPFFPWQAMRLFRVVIGTCVFTIHLLQFMRH